jgi:hypothetical protein
MRVSNPYSNEGPRTGRPQPTEKKGGRFNKGLGGLLGVVVIAAAVSGCGSGDKDSKADPAPSASQSAGVSQKATAAATDKAKPTTLLTLTGSGTKTTSAFKTGGAWTLSYTFDCSKAMAALKGEGNFIVFDKNDKLVNKMAKSGKDSTSEHTSGTRRLQIVSECDWTVKVTG